MNRKKIIFKLIVILMLVFVLNKFTYGLYSFFSNDSVSYAQNYNSTEISEYETIKLDYNDKYAGIGQQKVSDKDGYFTTFTDTSGKVYKEYKQNWTSSWADKSYWDGNMQDTGCGITAISIILSGYNYDITPENLRTKYYPVLNGTNISKELSKSFKINNSDFLYDSVSLSERKITEHLTKSKPVLICVWNKPTKNRWTTSSHYMVLLATDNNGMVYISNPNGLEDCSKSSGWYNFEEVGPYIAKVLYIN